MTGTPTTTPPTGASPQSGAGASGVPGAPAAPGAPIESPANAYGPPVAQPVAQPVAAASVAAGGPSAQISQHPDAVRGGQHVPQQPGGQLQPPQQVTGTSDKSFIATWLLSWLLGGLGVDRFYLGKIGTGIVKLITFGGLGVWWLIDLILVLAGATRDKYGRKLDGYDKHKKVAWIVTGAIVALSLIINLVSGGGRANSPAVDDSDSSVSEPVGVAEPAEEPADEAPAAEPAKPEPSEEAGGASGWADGEFGTFAPETHTGTGDNLITLPAGVTAAMVTASHDGSGHFAISALDANNSSTGDLLVNTIGSYSGTTAYGINALGDAVSLEVSADGNWEITIAPLSSAPALGASASGSGDAVFLYDGGAGRLTVTHDGERHFAVIEETGELFHMGLLVNEIGAYTGTVAMAAGPSVVTVTADGNWTLDVA